MFRALSVAGLVPDARLEKYSSNYLAPTTLTTLLLGTALIYDRSPPTGPDEPRAEMENGTQESRHNSVYSSIVPILYMYTATTTEKKRKIHLLDFMQLIT